MRECAGTLTGAYIAAPVLLNSGPSFPSTPAPLLLGGGPRPPQCARIAVPLHHVHRGNCGSCGGEVGRPTISPSLFRGPSPLPFVSRSQHVRRVEGRSPRRNFRLRGLHRGHQRACDSAQGSVLGYTHAPLIRESTYKRISLKILRFKIRESA